MIEIRAELPPDAPDEVKQFVQGLKGLIVPAPSAEELAAIMALAPGPEQDKLYNESFRRQFRKAMKALTEEIDAIHSVTCKNCSHGSH